MAIHTCPRHRMTASYCGRRTDFYQFYVTRREKELIQIQTHQLENVLVHKINPFNPNSSHKRHLSKTCSAYIWSINNSHRHLSLSLDDYKLLWKTHRLSAALYKFDVFNSSSSNTKWASSHLNSKFISIQLRLVKGVKFTTS